MSTYVLYREDECGDLLDVDYFDSPICLTNSLWREGICSLLPSGGTKTTDIDHHLVWGASPCATSEVEYPVYCGWCGNPMNEKAHKVEVS